MSNIPDDASSMSDDVFEDVETTAKRIEETRRRTEQANIEFNLSRDNYAEGQAATDTYHSAHQNVHSSNYGSNRITNTATSHHHHQHQHHPHQHHHHHSQHRSTTSSGYPGYRPPREALQMYAFEDGDDYDDGWRSYRYDEVDMYPQPQQQPFDDTINHKTILLGDSGVGKTSFLVKYNTGEFRLGSFSATVGIALTNKVVVVDNTRVKLQIWDTAGQERFRSVTHAYYRDAHALLLLYDVTNKTTYDNIRAWLGEIREYAQDDVVIVLIGNKADCSNSERQVKREDGERLAREHNVPFMETSAKTGLNVELAFAAVARQLKSRGNDNGDDGKFNVHDFVRDNTRARTICAQCKSM
ncbi:ras-related protein Rab-26-like isoform X2 [Teleopsis dalmanni]|uniref:ras-related protein Rab-26-like isoform X2 n=1 Tax=Teleopsis dalmanni TaxID=139649 RepID=UPI0018CED897|nr:ras-related protein Rab-26-like isoform X2 [Teleopsis dalmanni]